MTERQHIKDTRAAVAQLTSSPGSNRWIFGKAHSPTDSYRFTGEPMLFLHDHRRTVRTREYHTGRVGIGIFPVAAVGADKARLIFCDSDCPLRHMPSTFGSCDGREPSRVHHPVHPAYS